MVWQFGVMKSSQPKRNGTVGREYRAGFALGRYRGLQIAIYLLLGDQCAWCEEDDRRVFQIDHVKNDGAAHRRAVGAQGGPALLIDILRQLAKDPKRFQILCANCHAKKMWQLKKGGNGW
jgi:hypothetical protein